MWGRYQAASDRRMTNARPSMSALAGRGRLRIILKLRDHGLATKRGADIK